MVISATNALKEAYFFPADSLRQAHLGFLMAWLKSPGDRNEKSAAAAKAEVNSISTSIDPAVEKTIERAVDAYSSKDTPQGERERAALDIQKFIQSQLQERLELLEQPTPLCRVITGKLIRTCIDRRRHKRVLLREYLEVEAKQERGEWAYIPAPDGDPSPYCRGVSLSGL